MNGPTTLRRQILLLVACLAITTWGIVGLIQRPTQGWGGYVYNLEYVVEGTEPGGPADLAGLRAGDRVISVAGIPVEELPLYSRWPRALAPRAGETLQLTVERDGGQMPIDIVYGPCRVTMLHIGAAFIGLAFMLFGLWALFTVPTPAARALGSIGLVAGLATFGGGGPYLGTWDGLASHIQFAAAVLWSLLMLRFFLTFPKPKRSGQSRVATISMYALWGIFAGCLILELIAHPRFYHTFGSFGALLVCVYSLLAIIAMLHTVGKLELTERREYGMNLILWGVIVAVAASLLGLVAFALRLNLPGSEYLALLIAAIPLTMALAVRQHARAIDLELDIDAQG